MNSDWTEGDWNANGDFTSSDLVTAFRDGGYEQGPLVAFNAVPKPSAAVLVLVGLLARVGSAAEVSNKRNNQEPVVSCGWLF